MIVNNKRIAANTAMLYVRMLLCMLVAFYTTRIALEALGVIDYGLVNAIGGIVSMFSFVSITLSHACARFFSFEIGRNDKNGLARTFTAMVAMYAIGAVVLIVLLETIGLWYVYHKLNFPAERFKDVVVFFHLSVASLIIGWFAIPYNSLLVSFEDMSIYAGLSVFDALVKLGAALGVSLFADSRKLVFYGILLVVAISAHAVLNIAIARFRHPMCALRFPVDGGMFKQLLSFNTWQMAGAFSWTASEVFVNLLLNSFFGPIVNAARGVASQVTSGIFAFTQNFLTAARPQIVKSWAAGEKQDFYVLLKRTSKIGYILVVLLGLPAMFEIKTVLSLWLKEVPSYAPAFSRLVIATSLVNTFSHPIVYAAQATGKVALFEGVGSGVRILVWPVSWLLLNAGCGPCSVFYAGLSITAFCVLFRFMILVRISGISAWDYAYDVFLKMIMLTVVAVMFVMPVHLIMPEGIPRLLSVGVVSSVCLLGGFWLYAVSHYERKVIWAFVMQRVSMRKPGDNIKV